MPALCTTKPKDRAKGRCLHRMLGRSLWFWLIALVLVYLCLAFLFAGLYWRSGMVRSTFSSVGSDQQLTFWNYLHFSFTTQATVGYGDYRPIDCARWVAAFQALFGICLTSATIGLIVFLFLRPPAYIVFPTRCCYSPEDGRFRFRFLNEGADVLINASVSVDFHEYPANGEKTSRAHRLQLDDVSEGIVIESLHLSQYWCCPFWVNGRRIDPTNLPKEDVCFTLVVSGTLERTGRQVAQHKPYPLATIQCGKFVPADNDHRLLNEIREPTEKSCGECPLCERCPLEPAKRIRQPLRAPKQEDREGEPPLSIWIRWVG